MTAENKKYFIELFLKKCTLQSFNKEYFNISFQLFQNTYSIPEEKIEELRKIYTVEKYIEKIIPVIDESFTIEELKESIKFFSSSAGRKMLDTVFLKKVGQIGEDMFAQIEQEFVLTSKDNGDDK
jgi:hypothetical protein